MKRIYIIIILAVICGITAMAQSTGMAHQTNGSDRKLEFVNGNPVITYNDLSQTLTVNGNILVTYFELTIKTMDTQEIEFQDVFEGPTTTLDVSFLADGCYQVVYMDSRGTTYWKEFEKSSSWLDGWGTSWVDLNKLNLNKGK